jgi:hypothetical protein
MGRVKTSKSFFVVRKAKLHRAKAKHIQQIFIKKVQTSGC